MTLEKKLDIKPKIWHRDAEAIIKSETPIYQTKSSSTILYKMLIGHPDKDTTMWNTLKELLEELPEIERNYIIKGSIDILADEFKDVKKNPRSKNINQIIAIYCPALAVAVPYDPKEEAIGFVYTEQARYEKAADVFGNLMQNAMAKGHEKFLFFALMTRACLTLERVSYNKSELDKFLAEERERRDIHILNPGERVIYTHVLESAGRNTNRAIQQLF